MIITGSTGIGKSFIAPQSVRLVREDTKCLYQHNTKLFASRK
ncbi:MAG: hypothetical protein IPO32_18620 [Crocinitomicaceae bacterium]|nr:hypothetical protein [Crocinitomicaceae bacterium]